jgi:hypothetical protein
MFIEVLYNTIKYCVLRDEIKGTHRNVSDNKVQQIHPYILFLEILMSPLMETHFTCHVS